MRRVKVLGAFESPNGMTSHSYNPSLVLKAVFYFSFEGCLLLIAGPDPDLVVATFEIYL